MAVLRYFHQPPKATTSTVVVNNTAILTVSAALNNKVDKSAGRGLSQNNYSTPEKNKLEGVEEGAEVNVLADWNEQDTESDAYILNKPSVPILDPSGQIPASYLPSYVDDVLEYPTYSLLPLPGETGKIYVTTDTDMAYRWSGSTYVEISKSIITGVKGNAETDYRIGNVNLTAANIGLGSVVNLDLSKAIKSITRSGTTFTYTCLDGTTGTFTQQDNNTTYSAGSGLSLSGTTFSLALTKALVTTALGYTPPTSDTNTWRTVLCNGTSIGNNTLNLKAGTNVTLSNSNGTITISSTDTNTWPSKVSLLTNDSGYITGITKAMVTTALGYTPPTTDTNTWRDITDSYSGTNSTISLSQKGGKALYDALLNGYASSAGSATTATTASNLVDGYSKMTSAYNKAGLDYSAYTWLAGWNGYELRAVAKTQFATSGHNHSSYALTDIALTWSGSYSDGDYMLIHNGETGSGGGLLFRAITKSNTASWVDGAHKWVRIGGDTVTGELAIKDKADAKYVKFYNTNYTDFAGYVGAGSSSANYIFLEAYGNNSIIFRTNSALRCQIDGAGKWWFPNHTSLYGGGELNIRGSEAGGTIYLSYCCSMSGNSYWYIPTDGKAKFVSVSLGSDIRKKDIVSDTNISITTIAQAPLFKFLWKDKNIDDSVHIGTSAQYWKENTPELVTEEDNEDKTLSIEYSTLGVAASISIAKEVVKMQNKIDTLEQRILQLEELLSKLIK